MAPFDSIKRRFENVYQKSKDFAATGHKDAQKAAESRASRADKKSAAQAEIITTKLARKAGIPKATVEAGAVSVEALQHSDENRGTKYTHRFDHLQSLAKAAGEQAAKLPEGSPARSKCEAIAANANEAIAARDTFGSPHVVDRNAAQDYRLRHIPSVSHKAKRIAGKAGDAVALKASQLATKAESIGHGLAVGSRSALVAVGGVGTAIAGVVASPVTVPAALGVHYKEEIKEGASAAWGGVKDAAVGSKNATVAAGEFIAGQAKDAVIGSKNATVAAGEFFAGQAKDAAIGSKNATVAAGQAAAAALGKASRKLNPMNMGKAEERARQDALYRQYHNLGPTAPVDREKDIKPFIAWGKEAAGIKTAGYSKKTHDTLVAVFFGTATVSAEAPVPTEPPAAPSAARGDFSPMTNRLREAATARRREAFAPPTPRFSMAESAPSTPRSETSEASGSAASVASANPNLVDVHATMARTKAVAAEVYEFVRRADGQIKKAQVLISTLSRLPPAARAQRSAEVSRLLEDAKLQLIYPGTFYRVMAEEGNLEGRGLAAAITVKKDLIAELSLLNTAV